MCLPPPTRRVELAHRSNSDNFVGRRPFFTGGVVQQGDMLLSLKEKLDAQREASAKRIPPEKAAIMKAGIAAQRASGILQKVVAVGQKAPSFTGVSHDGRTISSADLLQRGPLVLSFFRGHW